MARQRHARVNSSLFGQQDVYEDPQLLNSIASRDRISGTNEVAGEVTVSEMSSSASVATSSVGSPQMTSLRRRRVVNDGRSGKKGG